VLAPLLFQVSMMLLAVQIDDVDVDLLLLLETVNPMQA
jgi:hypothetical protein